MSLSASAAGRTLTGYVFIAIVLVGVVVLVNGGEPDAWRMAAAVLVGVAIGDAFCAFRARRKNAARR